MRHIMFIMLLLAVPAYGSWSEYKNANQLSLDKEFTTELTRFFADAKGDYILPGATIAKQALEGLSGPGDDLKKLPGGETLASACRAHSCDEKTAVLLKGKEILAAALISFHCTGKPAKCQDNPVLTIFQKKGPDRAAPFLAWAEAKQQEADALMAAEAKKTPTLKTEFVTLP